MPIELQIESGPGTTARTERFEEPLITIGRDPTSDVRFDMGADLEVSTRHAEIRDRDGVYVIVDTGSTNGTWVNHSRLRDERKLHEGDEVHLGRGGAKLRIVRIGDRAWHPTVESPNKLPPYDPAPPRRMQRTQEWVVGAIRTHTRAMKLTLAGMGIVIIVLGVLVARNNLRTDSDNDSRLFREVTAPSIRRANDDAVALVETEIPGTPCARGCEGTGFSVTIDGVIVTNRHVVIQQGVRATRIRVKFANTRTWLPATILRTADAPGDDVALLRISRAGTYPAIVALSAAGPDLAIGSNVLAIGFPLGTTLRMQGNGSNEIALTTITIGSIGKMMPDVFQIDAFAEHGSSGSPVFDRHSHAIGIVSGGARGEGDEIVYVVPSSRIVALERAAGLNVTQ
jgi:Trypsin-like peptidase domain/FHA domain